MAHLNPENFRRKGREQTSVRVVAKRLLAQRVMALRQVDRLDWQDVVDRINADGGDLTVVKAQELVRYELKKNGEVFGREDLIRQQAEQVDYTTNKLMQSVRKGGKEGIAAASALTGVWNRQASLLGLDAPKQLELKDTTDRAPPAPAIQELVGFLAERARLNLAKRGIEYDPETGTQRTIVEGTGSVVDAERAPGAAST